MRTGFAIALFVIALFAALTPHAIAGDLAVELIGRPSVVYNSTRDACEPVDVPDVNPRAYRDVDGGIRLFALHFVNRALRGRDFEHLKLDCHVALGSPNDPDPAHYADRNFIAATWTHDGRSVSALVHHEYHADDHGRCGGRSGLSCWYNTVLAYRSVDQGETFRRAEPPVVAAAPFRQDVDQTRHRGFFNPSNIVADAGAFYMFASTTGWDGQPYGNCLFRTSDPSDPALWRAYDGKSFSIRYTDPYRATSRPKPCATVAPFTFPVGSVTRHKDGTWLAIFQASAGGAFPVEGFYYATGRDLLHWSEPKILLAGRTLYGDLCKAGPSIIGYPAVIDPAASGRNFDTMGDNSILLFTTMQVSGCQTGERLLLRQPLGLTQLGVRP